MGLAFKNLILALALPTLINAQCLETPTETTTTTTTTTPTPNYFDGTAECPPNQCWEGGCNINPNICQITCTTGDVCETACPDVQLEVAEMNATKCSDLCIEHRDKPENEKPCRFWRYDRVSEGQGIEKLMCTFLASDQCQYFSECSNSCECEDVGCPGSQIGTTEPPKKACKAPIVYHPGAAWIRWTCFSIDHPDLGSPYNPDTVLHAGTMCETTHKCADWEGEEARKLKVRCDGVTEADGDFGHWVPNQQVADQANYDGVLGDGSDVIAEHECKGGENPTTLEVTLADMGVGGDLSCEIPDTDEDPLTFTITAPNKCVLLCDYHLAMVIEGRLNDEGEFKFYVADSDPEVEINDSNVGEKIKCW